MSFKPPAAKLPARSIPAEKALGEEEQDTKWNRWKLMEFRASLDQFGPEICFAAAILKAWRCQEEVCRELRERAEHGEQAARGARSLKLGASNALSVQCNTTS